MRNTVVVFARAPRLGAVKRRLARDIGDRAALRFHVATMTRLLRALVAERRFRTVLAVTPDRARFRLPSGWARVPQGRGAAIWASAWTARSRGSRAGGWRSSAATSPRPGRATCTAAFRALGSAHAAFGPAADGGYWLVAMSPRRPARPFARCAGPGRTRWRTRSATSRVGSARGCDGSRMWTGRRTCRPATSDAREAPRGVN